MDYQKPFSSQYVIHTTIKHMGKCIETSIKKTLDRLPEFANDPEKSQEVFKTLGHLQSMRQGLLELQNENPESR
jgi:hypothetical protein